MSKELQDDGMNNEWLVHKGRVQCEDKCVSAIRNQRILSEKYDKHTISALVF